jgi:hypothetical protein
VKWVVWTIPLGLAAAFPVGLMLALEKVPEPPPPPPQVVVRAQHVEKPLARPVPVVTRGRAAMEIRMAKQVRDGEPKWKRRSKAKRRHRRLQPAELRRVQQADQEAWREAARLLESERRF